MSAGDDVVGWARQQPVNRLKVWHNKFSDYRRDDENYTIEGARVRKGGAVDEGMDLGDSDASDSDSLAGEMEMA